MGKFSSALLDAVKQRLLKSSCSNVTKMTIFAKAVDVFHKFFKAATSRLAFYIVLQAAGAAQVWPVKLPQQRAFASVYIWQRKCVVRSIRCFVKTAQFTGNNSMFYRISFSPLGIYVHPELSQGVVQFVPWVNIASSIITFQANDLDKESNWAHVTNG